MDRRSEGASKALGLQRFAGRPGADRARHRQLALFSYMVALGAGLLVWAGLWRITARLLGL